MTEMDDMKWKFHVEKLFFFQAEDGIRDHCVTGVQTCALLLGLNQKVLSKTLWGDFYFNSKTKKVVKGALVSKWRITFVIISVNVVIYAEVKCHRFQLFVCNDTI